MSEKKVRGKTGQDKARDKRKEITIKERQDRCLHLWLVEKKTTREIAAILGNITHATVATDIDKAWAERYEELGKELTVDVRREAKKQFKRAERLWDAAETWLTVNDAIDLDPRSTEVSVVYFDWNDRNTKGEPRQKKAELQDLLDKVSGVESGIDRPFAVVKTMDIRKFALESVKVSQGTIDVLAKLFGEYVKDKENPADIKALAQKVYQELVANGKPKEEALEFTTKRYGILEAELVI